MLRCHMPESRLKEIADNADMIVNGYAFTRDGDNIRIFNLDTCKAALMTAGRKIIESSMDDIGLSIAMGYIEKNGHFIGL